MLPAGGIVRGCREDQPDAVVFQIDALDEAVLDALRRTRSRIGISVSASLCRVVITSGAMTMSSLRIISRIRHWREYSIRTRLMSVCGVNSVSGMLTLVCVMGASSGALESASGSAAVSGSSTGCSPAGSSSAGSSAAGCSLRTLPPQGSAPECSRSPEAMRRRLPNRRVRRCASVALYLQAAYAEGVGRGAQVFGGRSQMRCQRVRHRLTVGAIRLDIHGIPPEFVIAFA